MKLKSASHNTIHFFVFFKGKHVEQLTVILGNRSPAAGFKKTETTWIQILKLNRLQIIRNSTYIHQIQSLRITIQPYNDVNNLWNPIYVNEDRNNVLLNIYVI